MPKIPLRDVMPYGSVLLRVPATWNEDPFARELCVYYYPGNGGPPMLHVRRDDFIYLPKAETEADVVAIMSGERDIDLDAVDTDLFSRFKLLPRAIDAADLYLTNIEPRSPHGQIMRYKRHGQLHDQPGISWNWIRGTRSGPSFTVFTMTLEDFAVRADTEEARDLVALFDREFCGAELLGIDEAKEIADAVAAEAQAEQAAARAAAEQAEADEQDASRLIGRGGG